MSRCSKVIDRLERIMKSRARFWCGVLLATGIECVPCNADELASVESAWNQRQSAIAAFEVELQIAPPDLRRMSTYQSSSTSDFSHPSRAPTCTLKMKGERLRLDTVRSMYDPEFEIAGYLRLPRRSYYTGAVSTFETATLIQFEHALSKSLENSQEELKLARAYRLVAGTQYFAEQFGAAGEHPAELIRGRHESWSPIDEAIYRPLLLWARPFAPQGVGAHSQPGAWRMTGSAYIGGAECLRLEETSADGFEFLRWVDPKRNFVVTREIVRQSGSDLLQSDVLYEPSNAFQWAPTSWTVIVLPTASINDAYRGRDLVYHSIIVEAAHLRGDASIADAEFEIHPAAGTLIFDRREQRYSKLDRDGREQLVPAGPRPQSDNRLLAILESPLRETAIVVAIVLCLGVLSVKRRRRTRADRSEPLSG
jgi:hypothetical protein